MKDLLSTSDQHTGAYPEWAQEVRELLNNSENNPKLQGVLRHILAVEPPASEVLSISSDISHPEVDTLSQSLEETVESLKRFGNAAIICGSYDNVLNTAKSRFIKHVKDSDISVLWLPAFGLLQGKSTAPVVEQAEERLERFASQAGPKVVSFYATNFGDTSLGSAHFTERLQQLITDSKSMDEQPIYELSMFAIGQGYVRDLFKDHRLGGLNKFDGLCQVYTQDNILVSQDYSFGSSSNSLSRAKAVAV